MNLAQYVPQSWANLPSKTTAISAARLSAVENGLKAVTDYVRAGVELVVAAASAANAVIQARVTGDAYPRFVLYANGDITSGDGTEDSSGQTSAAKWTFKMDADDTRDAVHVYCSSGGQAWLFFDEFGNPIFDIPGFGGPSVFGDNFRVFPGGDIFNPVIKLRSDGSVQMAKGDLANGVGVLAIGKATTAPTSHPDGTHTVDGSTTQAGFLLYMDPADSKLKAMSPSGTVTVLAT